MTEVQQADRVNAAAEHRKVRGRRTLAQNIIEGYVDHDPIVQKFAAERVAAEAGK